LWLGFKPRLTSTWHGGDVCARGSWSLKALGTRGGRLVRQRAAILIVLGLALLGGVCGWLLRDQLVKRGNELLHESTYQESS
jgi:hypothetical protein